MLLGYFMTLIDWTAVSVANPSIMAAVGVATLAGPLFGGVLVDQLSWEWIFFVNVPIGVIAFGLGIWLMPAMPINRHRFDVVGVVLSGVALFLVVFALQEFRSHQGAPWIWAMFGAGLVAMAGFVYIRAFLDEGINVIADDLIWTRDWLLDLLRVFTGYQVWLVGVHVSDEEGARREAARGNRLAGVNRGSARAAHAHTEYDFEIDTTDVPMPELARQLHDRYESCRQPAAFARLSSRYLS
ncbi:hypothetical protein MBOU_12670 [Mycobacterium bourgelatii]|uniref:MFS transporter n=2 Tax=Mycobacterium bourgelatii TaxID=1273442 RepID=A0A7I9YKK6_MYCBU|nr:hypothetical protein MBOU_12670 [Mycobacterium bourgelatii]